MSIFLITPLTFLVSAITVAGLIRYLNRCAVLDVPNHRSSHTVPTPRGGGLAISGCVLLGASLWAMTTPTFSQDFVFGFLLPVAAVALIGAIDDHRGLSARIRLVVQIAAAALTVAYLGPISTVTFYGFGVIELSSAAANFLTLVWIVGLTNAYNFMDGIDGIAGGCGAVAGLGWLLIGQQVGSNVHVTLGSLILGATAGFLIFNWSPAKIFMGDVGSLVLGFVLAAAPLLLPERVHQQGTALWIGALVVWPFVVDAGLTFLLRAYRRERLMDAHRSHLYQCLVQDGRSHSFVASIYVALTVFGVIAATTLPF